MIHEMDVLEALLSGEKKSSDKAVEIAKPIQGKLLMGDEIALAEPLLEDDNVVVVIDDKQEISAILSRIDFVRYLSENKK